MRPCRVKRSRLLHCALELRGDFHGREIYVHRIGNVPRLAARRRDREIDRELALRRRQYMTDARFQCIQVIFVTSAIRQFDVEIAGFFAK